MKSGRKMKSLFQPPKINQSAGDVLPDSPPAIYYWLHNICYMFLIGPEAPYTLDKLCFYLQAHLIWVVVRFLACSDGIWGLQNKMQGLFSRVCSASLFSCTSTDCLYFAPRACARLPRRPSRSTSQMEWKRDSPQGEPHLAQPVGGLLRGRPGESSPVFTCSCGGGWFLSH